MQWRQGAQMRVMMGFVLAPQKKLLAQFGSEQVQG